MYIYIGATSCYVGDNTDLIQMKESLILVRDKLVKLLDIMRIFSEKYKSLPALGYTHCQPAQLTTVGKRCTLWLVYIYITRLSIYIYIEAMYVRMCYISYTLVYGILSTYYIVGILYTIHYACATYTGCRTS